MPVFTEAAKEQACHLDACIEHGTGTVGCPIDALERAHRQRVHSRGVDLEVLLDG